MTIINILFILVGIFTLLRSSGQVYVYSMLYFDRDTYCVEKFRKDSKTSDIVQCVHNTVKAEYGITLILIGLTQWMGWTNVACTAIVVCFALLAVSILLAETFSAAYGYRNIIRSIKAQWKAQEHISPDHNHEVNLYRNLMFVTKNIPLEVLAMAISIFALRFFWLQ